MILIAIRVCVAEDYMVHSSSTRDARHQNALPVHSQPSIHAPRLVSRFSCGDSSRHTMAVPASLEYPRSADAAKAGVKVGSA